ncbi:hypothetical protein ECANGB1_1597 [Enterospora canceri]|uniref:Uncharacterized protein n=1 Tax=Enterospora canceri TaxID=1081671 RepID=A0A1Y1S6E1_9MICR|nr:hypothetical protein ECANGB1_1597 [Enterospora canceri]
MFLDDYLVEHTLYGRVTDITAYNEVEVMVPRKSPDELFRGRLIRVKLIGVESASVSRTLLLQSKAYLTKMIFNMRVRVVLVRNSGIMCGRIEYNGSVDVNDRIMGVIRRLEEYNECDGDSDSSDSSNIITDTITNNTVHNNASLLTLLYIRNKYVLNSIHMDIETDEFREVTRESNWIYRALEEGREVERIRRKQERIRRILVEKGVCNK